MMYLLAFVFVQKILLVEGISCCKQEKEDIELYLENDSDQVWITDFTSDHKYIDGLIWNFFKLSQRELVFNFVVHKTQFGYNCVISDHLEQILDIFELQLGDFHQLFLQFKSQIVELNWYSDFKLTKNKSISFVNNESVIIKNEGQQVCWQTINIIDVNFYVESCEQLFHIKFQLNPLFEQSGYVDFNNNYFLIQFWLKIIALQSKDPFCLYINGEFNVIKLLIQEDGANFYLDNIEYSLAEKFEGWNYFQLNFQRVNSILQYQSKINNKLFNISQQYSYFSLIVMSPYLTGLNFNLRQSILTIICPPGCLQCEYSGYCLQCGQFLELIDGFCECEQNYDFLISPTECYQQIDYEIEKLEEFMNQTKCPSYNGQVCPQCLNNHKGENNSYIQEVFPEL